MTETKYWLWLSLALSSQSRKITAVLEHFDTPEQVYNFKDESFFEKIEGLNSKDIAALMDKSTKNTDEVWEICKNKGIRLLTYGSPLYPENLLHIFDPPYVLYVRCKERINLNNYLKITMVGTRKDMTSYGEAAAKQLGYDLAAAGAVVVSGMAEGIDGASHEGALAAGGITVAVLGCGVDVVYPAFHASLMEKITENGMVISEFPPGTPPVAANFPVRNRIMSGLSEATVVVECLQKSGALITADLALEQGRELYAVPGDIQYKTSEGTHNLLRTGAKLAARAADILEDFKYKYENICFDNINTILISRPALKTDFPVFKEGDRKKAKEADVKAEASVSMKEEKQVKEENRSKSDANITQKQAQKAEAFDDKPTDFTKNLTSTEQIIMESLMLTPICADVICERTGLAPNVVNSSLTLLEMRGLVVSHPGRNFSVKV